MARGARYKKYSRRASSRAKKGSRVMLIILAVIVFLVLCLAVSVAIGTALGKRAESAGVEDKLDISYEEYYSGKRQVRAVDAYLYNMDYDVSNIWRGLPDFSFCLRERDGSFGFDPDLDFAPVDVNIGEDKLSEHIEYITRYDGNVSAYMYVSAFASDDKHTIELEKAFELALINKASTCGVGDILLILPEITEENVDEIEKYVSDASLSSTGASVGVLLSPELLQKTEEGVYYASRLRAVADFAAIDLRGATEANIENILRDNEYYISSYPLRGVFGEDDAAVCEIARSLGMNSLQVVGE